MIDLVVGALAGSLITAASAFEYIRSARRATKQAARTIRRQSDTIATLQNTVFAEREENRRQAVLLHLMDNAPRIDTAPHPAHLLPFGRPASRPTRMH